MLDKIRIDPAAGDPVHGEVRECYPLVKLHLVYVSIFLISHCSHPYFSDFCHVDNIKVFVSIVNLYVYRCGLRGHIYIIGNPRLPVMREGIGRWTVLLTRNGIIVRIGKACAAKAVAVSGDVCRINPPSWQSSSRGIFRRQSFSLMIFRGP
jgi:hypothetical protein